MWVDEWLIADGREICNGGDWLIADTTELIPYGSSFKEPFGQLLAYDFN